MKRTKLVTGIVLTALLSTSCVNEDYDLDDIDMNIGINTDLELPLINSGEVTLANFIGDNDFLKTVTIDGQEVFYATAKGSFRSEFSVILNGTVDNIEAPTTSIVIEDLPDFLKSDDVKLDLKNPVIIANIEGDSYIGNGTVTGNFKLTGNNGKQCVIKGLMAKAGKSSQYVAADNENIPHDVLDKDYGTPTILKPYSGFVNDIFKDRIPEKIEIELNSLTADGITPSFNINHKYFVNMDMTLYAPLCIGSSNFQLAYEATETGWQDDFDEDIRKMDVDEITLSATLENNLPLQTIVEIQPVDKNMDVIKGLSTLKVEGKENGSTAFSYALRSNTKGKTLNDFINGTNKAQALDGVKIVAKLKATDASVGQYITTNASAKITNIKTSIKGQFVYDAN